MRKQNSARFDSLFCFVGNITRPRVALVTLVWRVMSWPFPPALFLPSFWEILQKLEEPFDPFPKEGEVYISRRSHAICLMLTKMFEGSLLFLFRLMGSNSLTKITANNFATLNQLETLFDFNWRIFFRCCINCFLCFRELRFNSITLIETGSFIQCSALVDLFVAVK